MRGSHPGGLLTGEVLHTAAVAVDDALSRAATEVGAEALVGLGADDVERQSDPSEPSADPGRAAEGTLRRCVDVHARLHELAMHLPGLSSTLEQSALDAVAWLRDVLQQADPQQRREITDLIQGASSVFPWDSVRPSSEGLALLYNFSPFQDTGASVASKRLRDFGRSVDVIACSFLHKKKQDFTVEAISQPYVNRKTFLPLNPSWASWSPFKAFAVQASRLAEGFMASNGGYDFVYSRAMWAPSLYAGAEFKLRNPEVRWIAEFSDPLSLDVEGLLRGGPIVEDEVSGPLRRRVEKLYGGIPAEEFTIFAFAERLVYAFADEIIFTNEHQKQTMLATISNPELAARVERHSRVSNHPTLPRPYYERLGSPYRVDPDFVNLAYFGEFYSSRSIREVTSAMRGLPSVLRDRVRLHVFTNYIPAGENSRRPRQFSKAQFDALVARAIDGVGAQGMEDQVALNSALPYLEFLATSDLMDYLIVNDARSGDHHEVNPYLPSKWSDYSGSRAKVWGFLEEGSILSSKPVTVKTPVGDVYSARDALWSMVVDKFPEVEDQL